MYGDKASAAQKTAIEPTMSPPRSLWRIARSFQNRFLFLKDTLAAHQVDATIKRG